MEDLAKSSALAVTNKQEPCAAAAGNADTAAPRNQRTPRPTKLNHRSALAGCSGRMVGHSEAIQVDGLSPYGENCRLRIRNDKSACDFAPVRPGGVSPGPALERRVQDGQRIRLSGSHRDAGRVRHPVSGVSNAGATQLWAAVLSLWQVRRSLPSVLTITKPFAWRTSRHRDPDLRASRPPPDALTRDITQRGGRRACGEILVEQTFHRATRLPMQRQIRTPPGIVRL